MCHENESSASNIAFAPSEPGLLFAHTLPLHSTTLQEPGDSVFPPGQPDRLRRLSMPSSAASMAPVPSAQVPRLRVLVAASREEEAECRGEEGSLPGVPAGHTGRVQTKGYLG